MRPLSTLFKSLADPTRLQMLWLLLQRGELCVCEFVDVLEITQSKASRHLRHLVGAGLLDDRRDGTWVYFRIRTQPEAAAAHLLACLPSLFEGQIDAALLDRLSSWRGCRPCTEDACAP